MKPFRNLSLTAQLVVIVAAALFAAQAVNFALLLRETRALAESRSVEPAAVRLMIASGQTAFAGPRGGEEEEEEQERPDRHWRRDRPPRMESAPPRIAEQDRLPRIEAAVAERLAAAGAPARDVRAEIRQWQRRGREQHVMLVTASFDEDEWFTVRARAPLPTGPLVARLTVQTLIIFAVTLIPLLWFARRASGSLKRLAGAARSFRGNADTSPLKPSGAADVRALTEDFNAMRGRVAAMMTEKDQMLGAIGHDLRTPLAALRIRAESVEDDDERAAMIRSIEDMNRDLEDILLLARSGRAAADAKALPLSPILEGLAEEQNRAGRQIEMRALPPVRAKVHAASVRRAVRNLIDNAVLYGGGAVVEMVQCGADIRIDVLDEGPGIAPADLDRAAEAFVRLEASRNRGTGGSGLGLAIVRSVASAHGGRLELENRAGGGLRASLILPSA